MYKPKKETKYFEILGDYVGFEDGYDKYNFGYSTISDYDEDNEEWMADHFGCWTDAENVNKVKDQSKVDTSLNVAEIRLTDEQYKKYVSRKLDWKQINSKYKAALESIKTDKIILAFVDNYEVEEPNFLRTSYRIEYKVRTNKELKDVYDNLNNNLDFILNLRDVASEITSMIFKDKKIYV